MFGFRKRRRARLRRTPLTDSQRRVIEQRVVWLRQLPAQARQELEGLTQIFLAEKRFEGCGGLVITDEMRLVIATQACILLLGRHEDVYPGLETILVYPHTYVARLRSSEGGRRTLEEIWNALPGSRSSIMTEPFPEEIEDRLLLLPPRPASDRLQPLP